MSIQIDDGEFTRLHNTILEKLAIARLTASEYRCLFFLFRMTYGWQKKEDAISLSQWATGTGIATDKRHNVLRTLQGLIEKGVIYAIPNGNNHPMTWGFNKNFETWDAALFEPSVISPDNSAQTVITHDNTSVISRDNKTVISRDNYKRKKERLKKERERAQAPRPRAKPDTVTLRSPKVILYKSPHLDKKSFDPDTGFVRAGSGKTAVEIYYERFDIRHNEQRLTVPMEDDLVRLCPDLDRLREVIIAYERASYQRQRNVQLILDWYRDGVPDKPNGKGQASQPTNNGLAAIMDYTSSKGMFSGRNR